MEKREIKMGSVQAFLILRSIISVSHVFHPLSNSITIRRFFTSRSGKCTCERPIGLLVAMAIPVLFSGCFIVE